MILKQTAHDNYTLVRGIKKWAGRIGSLLRVGSLFHRRHHFVLGVFTLGAWSLTCSLTLRAWRTLGGSGRIGNRGENRK